MKKHYYIILTVIIIAILCIIFAVLRNEKTDTSGVISGKAIYNYNDSAILTDLLDEDLTTIMEIFDQKRLHQDMPSCGFREDVAVELHGNETFSFWIACDNCPIIYFQNADKYFTISDADNAILRGLLQKYGFHFPCL